MSLAVVGVSHRTAPLEVRERFVIGADTSEAVLSYLASAGCTEAVLLSTCNRTELYLRAPGDGVGPAAATRTLVTHSGLAELEAGAYLYRFEGRSAVEHLFRVVTSLDSLILGEAQIQGQVREAYGRAVEIDGDTLSVGPVLARLFETALRVGGRVRAETRLGTGAASIPSAAMSHAREVLGPLEDRFAVLLGAGEMSALALQCLRDAGVKSAIVVNRSEDRAKDLAEQNGASVLPWERLSEMLAHADIVVGATSAPHTVLSRAGVEHVLRGRDRPLVILDIALPRDADPSLRELPNVHLFDLDDLSQAVEGTFERRRSEVALAEQIVAEEVDGFCAWYRSRSVVPAIRELRARAEHIRHKELNRARAALRHLSAEDLDTVDHLTRRVLAKLLHMPTARLRDAAAAGHEDGILDAMRYLFALEARADRADRRGEAETAAAIENGAGVEGAADQAPPSQRPPAGGRGAESRTEPSPAGETGAVSENGRTIRSLASGTA